ncbi:hypothetical protein ACFPTR_01115 [Aliibacillus thermotolerans]|uniref:DUF4870 domain-containing protein n=1 Tax=Aliibacillus thermotolerans TaxID=1834418 RepID=A0ABW0U3Z7_9BACI|nr:hypothetical protein [Aliibacillus thermotolerans]MDA3128797.1 hypothetical protein [Aliibacillus thermotolerans]
MSLKEFIFILMLPAVVTFITMIAALTLQWMIEKEANNKEPLRVFHFVNIIWMIMMCGTSSIIFHGMILNVLNEKGWWTMSLYAYVYPLPFILITYAVAAPLFRMYIQPYRVQKGSNVVYLKQRRRKW